MSRLTTHHRNVHIGGYRIWAATASGSYDSQTYEHDAEITHYAERKKLSHDQKPRTANREAERTAPTGVGSGDWLRVINNE